jgi:hypothetical protein
VPDDLSGLADEIRDELARQRGETVPERLTLPPPSQLRAQRDDDARRVPWAIVVTGKRAPRP